MMVHENLNSYGMTLDYLRQLLADVADERLTDQSGGAVNHPAWVLGHLVHSTQAIGGELGLDPWLAEEWSQRFGTGSLPVADRSAYPLRGELLGALSDAQARLEMRRHELDDARMSVPLPDERYRETFPTVPTLGHAVLHILTAHAAVHVGQVSVWRRA
ncbi:MAG: DinB family protein, partial [Planctomycetaceae bacterium]|nr:DinB family protein [Planctomycetaceae bacterium]